MKQIFFFLLILISFSSNAQKAIYVYKNSKDSSFNCYLKIIPSAKKIKGLVIRDYSKLPSTGKKSKYQFTDIAVEKGLMVIYTCCSNFKPELCFTDSPLTILDTLVHEVVEKHNIPKNNIFIGGISASGTRALLFTKYCINGKSKFGTQIKGVFAVDSPLDFERFYNSAKKHGANFKGGMLSEAKMMIPIFEKKLKGTPENNKANYHKRSVYSQLATNGGNARFYKKTSMILFHEPDLEWWKAERNATYYDINSYDNVAFIHQLNTLGNRDAKLITTSGKGYQNGKRKCHSWSIVDEKLLVDWIINRLN